MRPRCRGERGSALILALLIVLILSAAGAALLSLASIEIGTAAAFRDAEEANAAARAALQVGAWKVGRSGSLSDVLDGIETPGPVGPAVVMAPADLSRRLDFRLETARIQAQSDAGAGWGANDPEWRLALSAPLAELLELPRVATAQYVAVWLADDPTDGDGNPRRDSNGRLWIRAQAYGRGRGSRGVEAEVERQPAWGPHVRVHWLRDAAR